MTYSILGQNLFETADRARQYFSTQYGATQFKCEQSFDEDLPLKPTWQANLSAGYCLCIEVRESPFSNTLYEFVVRCAARSLPVRLWVAVPQDAASPTFGTELRQAQDAGVGVVQIAEDGKAYELRRPVALSLFALKKTDLKKIPKGQREEVKTSEATFLDGSPDQGCQAICQALEQLTRTFAEHGYNQGLWRQGQGQPALKSQFFHMKPWAAVLEAMEDRIDVGKVKAKSATFNKQAIVRARGHTDWRNAVSHKPRSFKERLDRDTKFRTMFESTRDLLVDWYAIVKPFRLVK